MASTISKHDTPGPYAESNYRSSKDGQLDFRNWILPLAAASILPAIPQSSAQTNAPLPAATVPTESAGSASAVFDVASIRPHQGPLRVIAGFTASGPRLRLEGYNLRLLVQEAFNLPEYCVSFAGSNVGPAEQSDAYYDIAAMAEENGSPTRGQFRQMLQSMLADRFKLRFHHESKEIPVLALIVAKGGPRFKESTPEERHSFLVGVHGRNQTLTASKEKMNGLADVIESSFGPTLPVIDRTGLMGSYDLSFEATPEFRINNNSQPEDISIFTALEEQLGLKLDRQKTTVDMLVVDHIEKPSEN